MFKWIDLISEKHIGNHDVYLIQYYDTINDIEFYGVTVDCEIQFKGTKNGAEGAWRNWIRALGKR